MLIIVSLILLGIILMLTEMLLVPGVGVAGFGALASLAGACWYAFEKISTKAGIILTAAVLVMLVAMLIIILKKKTWKRFELKDEIQSQTNLEVEKINVGDRGFTLTRLAPMGTAKIEGTTIEVKSADNSMVDPGTEIEVTAIEDNKILVKTL